MKVQEEKPQCASLKVQAILGELEKLNSEIQRKSRDQLLCVTFSLVSVGTIIGVTIQNIDTNYLLLPAIPWILSVFGIMWLDHAIGIARNGIYIKDEIEDKVNFLLSNNSEVVLNWEHHVAGKRMKISFIKFFLPLFYFILPSVGAIVVFLTNYLDRLSFLPSILIIAFCTTLTMLLIYKWLHAMKPIEKKIRKVTK